VGRRFQEIQSSAASAAQKLTTKNKKERPL